MQEAFNKDVSPKLNNEFEPLFSCPCSLSEFSITGTEPGSGWKRLLGCLAGRLRANVKKALVYLVEGISDGRGTPKDISDNIYPVFLCVTSCTKHITWTGSFHPYRKPRKTTRLCPCYRWGHWGTEGRHNTFCSLQATELGLEPRQAASRTHHYPRPVGLQGGGGCVGIVTPRGHLAMFAGIFSCHNLGSATGF